MGKPFSGPLLNKPHLLVGEFIAIKAIGSLQNIPATRSNSDEILKPYKVDKYFIIYLFGTK